MNRFSTVSGDSGWRSTRRIFALGLSLSLGLGLLGGCYEGSKKTGTGGGNPNTKTGDGGVTTKPYGIAILDVIRPSDPLMAREECGRIPRSVLAIRKQELEARFQGVYSVLDAQADSLVMNLTVLDECEQFSPLIEHARRPAPIPASSKYKNKPA